MAKSDDKIIGLLVLIAIPIYILYKIFEFIAEIFISIYNSIVENKEIVIGIVFFGLAIYIGLRIYPLLYFKSKKFKSLKESISNHIQNCNDLNNYIEELKNSYFNLQYYDYGEASLTDNSLYNYSRSEWKEFKNENNVYNCSATVCKNASNQPIKYLCKYFDIKKDQKSLERFEKVLNDFLSVDDGLVLLYNEKLEILSNISSSVPLFIKKFHNERLSTELGFESIDLSDSYIPVFTFQYISAGGYSSTSCDIELNIENLNKLVQYLNDEIKWRKSIAGQRALMTPNLRDLIKERDDYKCCNCGNGTENEPNLLLEIDHIIPVSKGGKTTVENLQTLCWKCNRSKGAKVDEYAELIQ
ncbi:HNH endonuclease [Hyunsoonleella jejuensis]|uniref:HNH endonuclease n=1 Tax=Hyunsoonleella jejuensis TaxID=419940 RepID=A0A1H9CZ68_9FLAO|nr:HNH endonuclease [Hyunsoonleella jejuensis]SEQ06427.1 HNH endonuclease [Hyunsoonleella jejuensis]